MSKIIGVTVGTNISPAKVKEELKPVTSVNGNKPDKSGNVNLFTDETLTLKDGVLSVNVTQEVETDNTLPVSSAAVASTVGNIETLLKTI